MAFLTETLLTIRQHVAWLLCCSACWLPLQPAVAAAGNPQHPAAQQVEISLFLNKIYAVNTLDETYQIDAYLVASWQQPQLPVAVGTYENSAIETLLTQGLWLPALEFINVVGTPEIGNQRIEIKPAGKVVYNLRFLGTFTTDMNFRRFPFDHQQFVLQLEPFSYPASQLQFSAVSVSAGGLSSDQPGEWILQDQARSHISTVSYSHLLDAQGEPEQYSRLTVQIEGHRNPAYYLWSFLLPLSLIIASSWAVFWVDGFSDRLQTAFTMLLTVVAYAFYTSNILPRLPYTTLIEQLVVAGYCSIFIAVLLLVYVQQRAEAGHNCQWLVLRCRWMFPLGTMLVVAWLCDRQVLQ